MPTLIAFLFATEAIGARLNYVTIMDEFVLGSTALVFLALVEAVVTAYCIAKDREAVAVRMDGVPWRAIDGLSSGGRGARASRRRGGLRPGRFRVRSPAGDAGSLRGSFSII